MAAHRTVEPAGCLRYMELSRKTAEADELSQQPNRTGSTLAKVLAPEELRRGQLVTLLHEYCELPSYFWCRDNSLLKPEETVWIRYVPSTAGVPLKVKAVCLPFVLVKHPTGSEHSLDMRKCRLAQLNGRYATRAWKAYKKAPSSPPLGNVSL